MSGSNQLVEIGMVTAPGRGTAFPCVNWAGGAIEGFALTVHHELEYLLRSISLGILPVTVHSFDKKTSFFPEQLQAGFARFGRECDCDGWLAENLHVRPCR